GPHAWELLEVIASRLGPDPADQVRLVELARANPAAACDTLDALVANPACTEESLAALAAAKTAAWRRLAQAAADAKQLAAGTLPKQQRAAALKLAIRDNVTVLVQAFRRAPDLTEEEACQLVSATNLPQDL